MRVWFEVDGDAEHQIGPLDGPPPARGEEVQIGYGSDAPTYVVDRVTHVLGETGPPEHPQRRFDAVVHLTALGAPLTRRLRFQSENKEIVLTVGDLEELVRSVVPGVHGASVEVRPVPNDVYGTLYEIRLSWNRLEE